MSKMDRMLNSKKDKQTIYEIYRACRLCGAGAGYKMPIIQNVVDLDDTDIELKQKIRECVQIEVHQDDKMPPLICELCVDKVNDFYEFLEMCRQTNKRTRLRLGLPPQSLPGGAPDAGDCILGLTEPVYVNDDSDGEPLSKHKRPTRELKSNIKIKKEPPPPQRSTRGSFISKREPTPPRALRHSRHSREDSRASRSQDRSSKPSPKVSPKASPKSILKKSEDSPVSPRLKRTRDKEPVKLETPVKKVKIAVKPPAPVARPRAPAPPAAPPCPVCGAGARSPQALRNHLRAHTAQYTSNKLACNPCREWFISAEEAVQHHRQHRSKYRPYHCQRCDHDYTTLNAYDLHITSDECILWPLVPDVRCEVCWHTFATDNLLNCHRCLGEEHRPGGKCSKCNRSYALLRNLKKHESTCTAKRKKDAGIAPALLAQLKPIQVRVSRCDPLLLNVKQEHYDVSAVAADYGLDKNCTYPYISSFSGLGIKSELDSFRGMVSINPDVKEEFCSTDYIHWDSEESESDSDMSLLPLKKKVDTLATLTLKTIFSTKCLGKVPRKRRRVKKEKIFDVLDTEDDVTRDINNIIDNLDNDDDLDNVDELDKSVEVNRNFENDFDKLKNDEINENHANVEISLSNDLNDSKSENESRHNNDISVDNNGTINNSDDKIDDGEENAAVDSVNVKESSNNDKNGDGIENSDVSKGDDLKEERLNSVGDEKSKDVQIGDENDHPTETEDAQNDGINKNDSNKSEENDEFSKVGINDSSKDNIDASKDSESKITSKNDLRDANDDVSANDDVGSANDDSLEEMNAKDDVQSAKANSLSNISQDDDSRSNLDKNDENNDSKSNIHEDDLLKDSDLANANSQVTEKNETDSKIDEKLLLDKNDSQDSNSVSFNENSINNDVNEIKANEENSVSDINKEHEKVNGDVDKTGDGDNGDSGDKIGDSGDKDKKTAEEIEDSKLMAALDAQIGENDNTSDVADSKSYGFNDKIALEDLLAEKNTTKSVDLDILPEEYNFDN
ncbi:unnamed protein product [Chrysodeixis includens]|uniref:Uncharacterized protein n=1 Tax=Chrysodeixis includens TaxID=689277 RepID=A0A9P0C3B7_CHRIL|nr:unnamed protein product [Chrysodeixis includens]